MIISASRRTDIPAFYGNWLIERLISKEIWIKNPYNYKQIKQIDLSPENVECIVFWTKNPQPFFTHLQTIKKLNYPFYFHFTLNAYGKDFEIGLPKKKALVESFKKLSEIIGDRAWLIWRYDPIIINSVFSLNYHIENFQYLCECLEGYTNKCITSFITMYAKTKQRLKNSGIINLAYEDQLQLMQNLKQIASNNQIDLSVCASSYDFSSIGVFPAKCIDKELIEQVSGKTVPLSLKKDKNQRANCNCIKSIDIGEYNTCKYNCLYCYANK